MMTVNVTPVKSIYICMHLRPCYKARKRRVPRDRSLLYKESSPSFSLLYKGELATVRLLVEEAGHLGEIRNRIFSISLQESLFPLKDSPDLNSDALNPFHIFPV